MTCTIRDYISGEKIWTERGYVALPDKPFSYYFDEDEYFEGFYLRHNNETLTCQTIDFEF